MSASTSFVWACQRNVLNLTLSRSSHCDHALNSMQDFGIMMNKHKKHISQFLPETPQTPPPWEEFHTVPLLMAVLLSMRQRADL